MSRGPWNACPCGWKDPAEPGSCRCIRDNATRTAYHQARVEALAEAEQYTPFPPGPPAELPDVDLEHIAQVAAELADLLLKETP